MLISDCCTPLNCSSLRVCLILHIHFAMQFCNAVCKQSLLLSLHTYISNRADKGPLPFVTQHHTEQGPACYGLACVTVSFLTLPQSPPGKQQS